MTLNINSKNRAKRDMGMIEARRRLVASLRIRGYSQRQIHEGIGKTTGGLNPETGQPWSLGTINADVRVLEKQWRAEALGDTGKLKGKVLAEIRAIRAAAWQMGGPAFIEGLRIVLQTLKQERELLGLDEPMRIDITERIREMAKEEGWDPDEAVREAQRIVERLDGI